jgi:hypothetical protein
MDPWVTTTPGGWLIYQLAGGLLACAGCTSTLCGLHPPTLVHICKPLHPLSLNTSLPTIINSNNQSAILLVQASQQAFHPRMKHIDTKTAHHEVVAAKTVVFTHCPMGQMIADMLTQALPRPKLKLKDLVKLCG